MPGNSPALVVVTAGGLGTRVHPWARFIPKEFYPAAGRPGIALLLEEIASLGSARVVIVYHPYYEQFAAWARQVLEPAESDPELAGERLRLLQGRRSGLPAPSPSQQRRSGKACSAVRR
jgi:molybdopterin-guanine dinucleotide biosynthesis protein A